MKRILLVVAVLAVTVTPLIPQDKGAVNVRGPLRGIPNSNGIVMAVLEPDETFGIVQQKGPWYLLQTSRYVGWMHGNFIRVIKGGEDLPDLDAYAIRPRTTTKPANSAGGSPFREEYVGGTDSTIHVSNSSDRTMNLDFGGVRYVMKSGEKRNITVDGGNYEFTASARGVRPKSGVREFRKGYSYTWNFFIITTRS